MSGMFKKVMLYLGLGSDEDFEALDGDAGQSDRSSAYAHEAAPVASHDRGPTPAPRSQTRAGQGHGRLIAPPERAASTAVRPLPAEPSEPARPSVVRTIPAPKSTKPIVVAPVSFNDAQEVADAFKKNQPVIVNLQNAERELTRRIIDFASGLCYGVGGAMKKVGDAVYLLTPDDVEVSAEDQLKLREAGLYDH